MLDMEKFVRCHKAQERKIYKAACILHSQGTSASGLPIDEDCIGCTTWQQDNNNIPGAERKVPMIEAIANNISKYMREHLKEEE